MEISEKISFIVQNHGRMKNREIAERLGMSEIWVKTMVSRLLRRGLLQPKAGRAAKVIEGLTVGQVLEQRRMRGEDLVLGGKPSEGKPSFKKGLKPGLTRHSLVIREDYLLLLKCLSNHRYTSVTKLFGEAIGGYLAGHRDELEGAWSRFVTMNQGMGLPTDVGSILGRVE